MPAYTLPEVFELRADVAFEMMLAKVELMRAGASTPTLPGLRSRPGGVVERDLSGVSEFDRFVPLVGAAAEAT
jgi:hypothetical protein